MEEKQARQMRSNRQFSSSCLLVFFSTIIWQTDESHGHLHGPYTVKCYHQFPLWDPPLPCSLPSIFFMTGDACLLDSSPKKKPLALSHPGLCASLLVLLLPHKTVTAASSFWTTAAELWGGLGGESIFTAPETVPMLMPQPDRLYLQHLGNMAERWVRMQFLYRKSPPWAWCRSRCQP